MRFILRYILFNKKKEIDLFVDIEKSNKKKIKNNEKEKQPVTNVLKFILVFNKFIWPLDMLLKMM